MVLTSCLFALLLAAKPTPTPAVTPTPQVEAPLGLLAGRGSAEREGKPESLADVAKRTKLKMPTDKPRIINNANLQEYAAGVELTTTKVIPGDLPRLRTGSDDDAKKAHWQQRYRQALDAQVRWEAEVKRLEADVARLQTEFYSRDDPAQRDGVIKPAWDRALLDLQKAKEEAAKAGQEPDRVVDAGRRAGALPGWFRGVSASPNAGEGPLPSPTPKPGAQPPI